MLNSSNYSLRLKLGIWACTSCRICADVCPAVSASQNASLSGIYRISMLRKAFIAKWGPIGRLLGGHMPSNEKLKEFSEQVFKCTLCGNCEESCPMGISLKDIWLSLRRDAVQSEIYPEKITRIRENIEESHNVFGEDNDERAEWVGEGWLLKDVTVYDLDEDTTRRFKNLFSTALEEPRIFREEMKRPDEMNFIELYKYYNRLEKAGFRNTKYIIRLYEKLAYPTVNFIMVLFALSLALNAGWGGGIWSAGVGILIIVLYWLIYSISISLGNTDAIPPWSAPWIGPVLFGVAGVVLFTRIRE